MAAAITIVVVSDTDIFLIFTADVLNRRMDSKLATGRKNMGKSLEFFDFCYGVRCEVTPFLKIFSDNISHEC